MARKRVSKPTALTGADLEEKGGVLTCIFCGHACTHTTFTVRESQPMHLGCLWEKYKYYKARLEEFERPQDHVLGY